MAQLGIGLDRRSELLYRQLLRRTNWRTQELAQAMGWSAAEVGQVLETLRAQGLASADGPTAFRAIEPCIALPALLARSMHEGRSAQSCPVEIDRFIALHERAAERMARSAGGSGHRNDMSTLVERLVARAEHDVVYLVPGYVEGGFALSRPIADMMLRRGIRMRAVWSSSIFRVPAAMSHAQWLAQQGIPPRMAGTVPLAAVVVDGTAAVAVDPSGGPRVVRSVEELETLSALAERLWERGTAVRQLRRNPAAPTRRPRTEIVLRLLAEGLTDDAIARRLGCSVRTVRNDVASAMAALDARSRFQAGVRAMQVGLI